MSSLNQLVVKRFSFFFFFFNDTATTEIYTLSLHDALPIPRPDLIFADEPTGALDTRTGIEILSFMRRAVDDEGQTIVMVTHDPHAASYADNVLFLADGQIVDEMADPTADRVLDRMK